MLRGALAASCKRLHIYQLTIMCKQVDELSEQLVKAQAQNAAQNVQGIENKARSAQAACARKVRTLSLTCSRLHADRLQKSCSCESDQEMDHCQQSGLLCACASMAFAGIFFDCFEALHSPPRHSILDGLSERVRTGVSH